MVEAMTDYHYCFHTFLSFDYFAIGKQLANSETDRDVISYKHSCREVVQMIHWYIEGDFENP